MVISLSRRAKPRVGFSVLGPIEWIRVLQYQLPASPLCCQGVFSLQRVFAIQVLLYANPSCKTLTLCASVEIKRTLDELLHPSGPWRRWGGQVTYESLSLLCNGAGVVGGAAFVESEEFVERLSLRLQQDLQIAMKTDPVNNVSVGSVPKVVNAPPHF